MIKSTTKQEDSPVGDRALKKKVFTRPLCEFPNCCLTCEFYITSKCNSSPIVFDCCNYFERFEFHGETLPKKI